MVAGEGLEPPTRRFTYGYNGVSERTSLDVSNAATFYRPQQGAIDVYSPNALNQYATVNAQAYVYDGNGNLTDDGVNVYGYDSESRLTSFVSASVAASYRYDALDRRIEKTVEGAITVFLHAGAEEIAEYDSSGTLLRRFVPGAGFGEIIATVEASGVRTFHHEDGLGSTVARSNDAGLVTEINAYGPFGEGTAPHGGNPFGFTGQRFDAESGLYYFRARYYSPTLGRFLQPDPAGFVDGLNLYTYARNSPITFNDPLGLASNPNSGGGSFDLLKTAGQEFGAAAKSAVPFYDAYNAFQQGSIATGVVLTAIEFSPAKLAKAVFKFGRAAVRVFQAAKAAREAPAVGQRVYRVWGDRAGPTGRSWSRTDPRTVQNYRNEAGLPQQNSGRFVSEGTLVDTKGVSHRRALPLHGNKGGLDELVVPDPSKQIRIDRVSGVNPEF